MRRFSNTRVRRTKKVTVVKRMMHDARSRSTGSGQSLLPTTYQVDSGITSPCPTLITSPLPLHAEIYLRFRSWREIHWPRCVAAMKYTDRVLTWIVCFFFGQSCQNLSQSVYALRQRPPPPPPPWRCRCGGLQRALGLKISLYSSQSF